MDKDTKRMIIGNIIKFTIWIVLLTISYVYIQNHPAEKVSVLSGFEVMYQRANVFVHKVVGDKWDLLKKKYSLQKYYKELVRMAENQKCSDVDIIKELNQKYQELKKIKIEEFQTEAAEYTRLVYKYDAIVKEWCK